MNLNRKIAGLAMAGTMTFALAACGGGDTEPVENTPANPPSSTESPDATETSEVFGAGCEAVPADGKGSFNGMATDPVATAASNNPLLSTLVTAVGEAGLVDTLNSAPELTVFAPVNDAFGEIPEADLNALLGDKEALTEVLTHHVIAGKLAPADLAGEHETLAGDTLTVEGSGEDFKVGEASVICGNVQTANATVYIIDGVLQPAA